MRGYKAQGAYLSGSRRGRAPNGPRGTLNAIKKARFEHVLTSFAQEVSSLAHKKASWIKKRYIYQNQGQNKLLAGYDEQSIFGGMT